MLVEHAFVTTLEAGEALRRATEFLASRGFHPEQSGFALTGQWDAASFRRGREKVAKAKSIAELPQQVRLLWDRGRVTVAASIQTAHGLSNELPANSPKARIHTQLLIAIAESLERLLANQLPPEAAAEAWDVVNLSIEDEARSRGRKRTTLLVIAGVFAAAMVGLVVFAAMS